jgi:hypothetical protein
MPASRTAGSSESRIARIHFSTKTVEEVGLARRESALGEELLPRPARCPREPVVVGLCPRDRHARGGQAVERHGLALLNPVPHQDEIRLHADQRLAGQMVPARHRQRRPKPERSGRLQIVELRGSELDERRHEHRVGSLLAQPVRDRLADRNCLFEPPETRAEGPAALAALPEGVFEPADDGLGRPRFRARTQMGRLLVRGFPEPQVVDRQPEAAHALGLLSSRADGSRRHRDIRRGGQQGRHQLGTP